MRRSVGITFLHDGKLCKSITACIEACNGCFGGLVGNLIALVVIAVVEPQIKKESLGPILFKQTRIGLNGKRFKIYKIRSMYLKADERKAELMKENRVSDGMMFKMDWDPRIIGNNVVDGK